MDYSIFDRYWPLFLGGLWTTVSVCALSLVLGVALGLLVMLLRLLHIRFLNLLCRSYIEFFRGTPILIQLFLLYYVAPRFGLVLPAVVVGIAGLGVYVGAYFAEIFRAGLESIPKGQLEAAACLGMSKGVCLRRIIFPQMLSLIIPPGINQVIILIKDSAVLSIITVPELTKQTAKIVNLTFAIWEPYLALALLYWAVVEAVSRLGNFLELRLTRYLRA